MKKSLPTRLCLLAVLLISFTAFQTNAFASSPISSAVLDNDNGAIDSSQNMYDGTWTHGNYSGDYRGDHRLSATGGDAIRTYVWKFTQVSSEREFYAYLNNPNFTDPSANYGVWKGPLTASGEGMGFLDGYNDYNINQNTAPPGWIHVNKSTFTSYSSYTYMFVSQSSPSAHTGADGAEIDYYQ
jgi:hypothetical protein